ncbi:universal stress protein [Paracoccus lutimaris]|uniref:Nucleotide-binding universal stress UspA family protein n=1 Tax=Paracoccus lutimaris TaxID=1490030 RepID=A0A368YE88_9RHOB|nr:universal stress protein [Paracoccus lutimaris]RCW78553.1 nucleotide-binding universal stress UspA family protein [Paracoccus lutimaris]
MSNQYIVAYDGSPAAQRAVDYAVERSKTSGAAILIAHVLEWSPYSFLTQEELAERHMRRTEELARAKSAIVDPVVASLTAKGVPVTSDMRYGNVPDTLVAIAQEADAAQIIIGRTGQSTIVARLFGSVAGTLAQMSPVPVTIVP